MLFWSAQTGWGSRPLACHPRGGGRLAHRPCRCSCRPCRAGPPPRHACVGCLSYRPPAVARSPRRALIPSSVATQTCAEPAACGCRNGSALPACGAASERTGRDADSGGCRASRHCCCCYFCCCCSYCCWWNRCSHNRTSQSIEGDDTASAKQLWADHGLSCDPSCIPQPHHNEGCPGHSRAPRDGTESGLVFDAHGSGPGLVLLAQGAIAKLQSGSCLAGQSLCLTFYVCAQLDESIS